MQTSKNSNLNNYNYMIELKHLPLNLGIYIQY